MERDELLRYLDATLETARFRIIAQTVCRVEGRAEVRRLVAGVTAKAGAARSGDRPRRRCHPRPSRLVLEGEDGRITGIRRRRIGTLLATSASSPTTCRSTHTRTRQQRTAGETPRLEPEGRFGEAGHRPVRQRWRTDDGQYSGCGFARGRCWAVRRSRSATPIARYVASVGARGGARGYFRRAIALWARHTCRQRISEADRASGARIRRCLPCGQPPCHRAFGAYS